MPTPDQPKTPAATNYGDATLPRAERRQDYLFNTGRDRGFYSRAVAFEEDLSLSPIAGNTRPKTPGGIVASYQLKGAIVLRCRFDGPRTALVVNDKPCIGENEAALIAKKLFAEHPELQTWLMDQNGSHVLPEKLGLKPKLINFFMRHGLTHYNIDEFLTSPTSNIKLDARPLDFNPNSVKVTNSNNNTATTSGNSITRWYGVKNDGTTEEIRIRPGHFSTVTAGSKGRGSTSSIGETGLPKWTEYNFLIKIVTSFLTIKDPTTPDRQQKNSIDIWNTRRGPFAHHIDQT